MRTAVFSCVLAVAPQSVAGVNADEEIADLLESARGALESLDVSGGVSDLEQVLEILRERVGEGDVDLHLHAFAAAIDYRR